MTSDADLVKRVLVGETERFRTLIERYQDAVFGVALSKTGSLADAEDIAQEAFLAAFEALPALKQPERFGSWLYGIALNKTKMHLRREGTRNRRALPAATTGNEPAADELAAQRETRTSVMDALGRLSDANRETATLYYIDGYSQADISRFTTKPLGTIKSRLHKARKQLRKELTAMVEDQLKRSRPGRQFTDRVLRKVSRVRVLRSGGKWNYVLLTDVDGRSFMLEGRIEEAEAIARRLSVPASSNSADMFDVLLEILAHFECQVRETTLVEPGRSSFSDTVGVVQIHCDEQKLEVETAPGDAISLAVRVGAPIYIERGVADHLLLRRKDGKAMSQRGAWRQVGQLAEQRRLYNVPFRDVEDVIRALKKDTQSARARHALTHLCQPCDPPKIKNTTNDLKQFEKCVRACKGTGLEAVSSGLLGSLYLLEPTRNPDKAIAMLERARELASGDVEIAFDLATAYALARRGQDALDILERLSKEGADPGDLRKRVTRSSNFRNLWRRARFRALFGKPDPIAAYRFFSAQIDMYFLHSHPAKRGTHMPRTTSRGLAGVNRTEAAALAELLQAGPLLRATRIGTFTREQAREDEHWLALDLGKDCRIEAPLASDEHGHVDLAIRQGMFVHAEAAETFCNILEAVGTEVIAAALLKQSRGRFQSTLVTGKGDDMFVTRHRGIDPVVIALWAGAPLLVDEQVAEKLRVPHER